MQCPEPGNRAEGHFQTARPIDATPWWVGIEPSNELCYEGLCVPLVLGKKIRLAQRHEMAVPIKLPCHFLVTGHGRIEIVDSTPVIGAGPFAGGRLEMPING